MQEQGQSQLGILADGTQRATPEKASMQEQGQRRLYSCGASRARMARSHTCA